LLLSCLGTHGLPCTCVSCGNVPFGEDSCEDSCLTPCPVRVLCVSCGTQFDFQHWVLLAAASVVNLAALVREDFTFALIAYFVAWFYFLVWRSPVMCSWSSCVPPVYLRTPPEAASVYRWPREFVRCTVACDARIGVSPGLPCLTAAFAVFVFLAWLPPRMVWCRCPATAP
jgi:hypothetical protein